MSTEHALPLLLKQLRLPIFSQHWQEVSEMAQKGHWTYPKFSSELAEQELSVRVQNKIQRICNKICVYYSHQQQHLCKNFRLHAVNIS